MRDEGNVYDIDFRDIEFVARYQADPWWGRGEAISLTSIPRAPETKIGRIHDVRIQQRQRPRGKQRPHEGPPESRVPT